MYILVVKITMCKKPYPDLIHKKLEKMLLFTSIKNTRGHYAHQKFYNQSPVPIRIFRPTT